MVDTLFLRAIAIILITNSHLDNLYPVAQLSTGGALGNSLFFMLSGLGLALGARKKGVQSFLFWMHRRLARIYPSIWITVLLLAFGLEGGWQTWSGLLTYAHELIYPTAYWFISALVVFYVLIYPLLCKLKTDNGSRWLVVGISLLFVPYLFFYLTSMDLTQFSVEGRGYFKWIYYFQIMLFGAWLSGTYDDQAPPTRKDLGLLALTLFGYAALKVLIATGHLVAFQCLVQWCMFPFVYFALKAARHPWVQRLEDVRWARFLITILGTATLEIYLVQHHVYGLDFIVNLPFPLNILVFAVICVPVAYGVHKLSGPVQKVLGRSAS